MKYFERQFKKTFFEYTRDLFDAIWLYMPATLGVAIIYYALMALPAAVDTLMITGERLIMMILVIVVIVIWSYIIWFSSRLLSYLFSKEKYDDNFFYHYLPRYLAINCFVAIQCAILALKHVFNLSGWWIVFYIVCHTLFYILLEKSYNENDKLTKERGKPSLTLYWYVAQIIGWLYILGLICLSVFNYIKYKTTFHSWSLPLLAVFIYGVQVCSIWFYTFRKNLGRFHWTAHFIQGFISLLRKLKITEYHQKLLECFGLGLHIAQEESPFYLLFNIIFAIGFIAYILCIKFIGIACYFGPLAFTILALSILVGFFNGISFLSIRSRFNFNIILIGIAVLMGALTNKHQVETVPSTNQFTTKLMPVDSFWSKWINDPIRSADIEKADSIHNKFNIYLILSDGGGARSAVWTSKVLATFQDRSETGNSEGFKKHVLAIAGASGGSVGNIAFYGLLKQNVHGIGSHVDTFFNADFLTYTLGRFLGPDFFSYLSPFNLVNDRATALASTFEYSCNDTTTAKFFSWSSDTAFDYTGRLPALFVNTTEVRSGMTSVISNIELKNTLRENIFNRICPGHSLKMSTIAVLSARFPYVSPAGEINGKYYVDGGYFDNSGAGTMAAFIKDLDSVIPRDVRSKLIFNIVEIHNGPQADNSLYHMHPLVNDLFAPVLTLIGIQNASTRAGNVFLEDYMREKDPLSHSLKIELYPPDEKNTEEYSMSWINSSYQINRMKDRLKIVFNDSSVIREVNRMK